MTQLLLREQLPAAYLPLTARRTAQPGCSTRNTNLSLQLVSDLAALDGLEAEWNGLSATAARPAQAFQSFGWCWHWCRTYLDGSRNGPSMAIVTGRIAGRLVVVAPFAVQRSAGVRELVWLGEPVTQYGDILAAPEAADVETLLAVWQFAVGTTRADVANLRKVRADATAAPLLAHLGTVVTAVEEAPYLDLSGETSFEGWEERRQPRARKNRKRQARRLSDTGEVRLEHHAASDEARELARRAVSLKRSTLDSKGAISPALADARFETFFAEAAGDSVRPSGAVVRSLSVDGEPAALKVLIENHEVSMLHVAVFDPRFERCGAGAILLEHLIRESIREGRKTLDLLAPRHDYKMDFADGVVLVSDHALAISSVGSLYARCYLAVRRHLKAVVEAMPVPVRRLVARIAK
ncbi:MAG: GNAT family N-acetyltransferase [Hyphomicrobiaceae bacterium]|nr:GNAT family N-acetyltransferase [Hyphomicrobiaceae bacterium]